MSSERSFREAVIALGSNLGRRRENLREALRQLARGPAVEIVALSSVYESLPVGRTDQPSFLNMAAGLRTELDPEALLHRLLEVEQRMGRIRREQWEPRVIDLDLILYEDAVRDSPELRLPHPRFPQRPFVLLPLLEVLRSGNLSSPAWTPWRKAYESYANREGILNSFPLTDPAEG